MDVDQPMGVGFECQRESGNNALQEATRVPF